MAFDIPALSSTLASIRDMLPTEVTIGSDKVNAVRTLLGTTRQVDLVGEYDNVDFALRFVKQELDDLNIDLNLIHEMTVDSKVYQVMGFDTDAAKVGYTVALGDKNA